VDKNRDGCESLTNFSHPVVLLQCSDSGSDRFVEGLCRDLYRVLNVLKILESNCARSEDHEQENIMFALCSLRGLDSSELPSAADQLKITSRHSAHDVRLWERQFQNVTQFPVRRTGKRPVSAKLMLEWATLAL
jgi:hypothetical protein